MFTYEGRLILSIIVIAGLIFSIALGITEFNKAINSKERLKFGLLSVFSIISIVLVSNII